MKKYIQIFFIIGATMSLLLLSGCRDGKIDPNSGQIHTVTDSDGNTYGVVNFDIDGF